MGMTPLREAAPAARALAQRALELDPSLPEAHSILCSGAATYDYNWKEAARRFALATADDSASPHGVTWSADRFLSWHRAAGTEAVHQLEQAVQGDPLQLTIRICHGDVPWRVGRYAEAEEQFRQAMHLDASFFWAYVFFAELLAARGMFEEALPFAERAFSLAPWYVPSAGIYAGVLVRTGEQDRGKEWFKAGLRRGLRNIDRLGSTTSAAAKSIWPRIGSRRLSKNGTPWSWRVCRAPSGNPCAPARAGRN